MRSSDMAKKLVVDTCVIVNYIDYLKEYNISTVRNRDVLDFKEETNTHIEDIITYCTDLFSDPNVASLNFKQKNFQHYKNVNDMCVKLLESDKLQLSQKELVVAYLKKNYNEFKNKYNLLGREFDQKTKSNVVNGSLLRKVDRKLSEVSDLEKSFRTFEKSVEKYGVIALFDKAKSVPPEVELCITDYTERELFTHIKGSVENAKAKANGNNVDLWNETLLRNVMKDFRLYKFYDKARGKVAEIVDGIKAPAGTNYGVSATPNALGEDADANFVAAGQVLGIPQVTNNLKDERGVGIDSKPTIINPLAKTYAGRDLTDKEVEEAFAELESYVDNSPERTVEAYMSKVTGKEDAYSKICSPTEAVDKIDLENQARYEYGDNNIPTSISNEFLEEKGVIDGFVLETKSKETINDVVHDKREYKEITNVKITPDKITGGMIR